MRFILFLLGLVAIISHPAWADDKKVSLDIFAGQDAAIPGQSFDLAIRQNIAEGWHTYWLNPGDSGETMEIVWDAPLGVKVMEYQYPAPDVTQYGDDFTSYTMKNQPIITVRVSVPEGYNKPELTLKGAAYWLVCEEICIPERQDIAVTLRVAENAESINQPIFDQAERQRPQNPLWHAGFADEDKAVSLSVAIPEDILSQMADVTLIPYDIGVLNNNAVAIADFGNNDVVTFEQEKGFANIAKTQSLPFILKTDYASYAVVADNEGLEVTFKDTNLLWILILAFGGGLILNLMPCVFPVLSMKALSLIQLSRYERRHAQLNGLAYMAGIVVSFLAIASLLIGLKSGGEAIGWGFQLQNPWVIAGLLTVVLVVGLNLAGAYDIKGSALMSFAHRWSSDHSLNASFLTGVLATAVATPCTAPFMATAVGYALIQDAWISLLVFAMLGVGLAFPYVVFCFVPQCQKILPKPGAWMETFKKCLSLPMFLTAIWLGWILAQQTGLLADHAKDIDPFTNARLEQVLVDQPDRPVFTNMTASWCITCLVNEKTSLSSKAVQDTFLDNNVVYIKGDWTNQNPEITYYLESFNRDGVPLYVYYPPADNGGDRPEPIILPQILTPSVVIGAIKGEVK